MIWLLARATPNQRYLKMNKKGISTGNTLKKETHKSESLLSAKIMLFQR